jgi:hypothetical protein
VLVARKRVLGEHHPDTLESMALLSQIYEDQGRLQEAKVLGVQALEGMEKVLGATSQDA